MMDYTHIIHSSLFGFLAFLFMVKVLKQSTEKAWGRSIILSSIALIYMVMFGHSFPPQGIQPYLL
jgi:hypothetical protein